MHISEQLQQATRILSANGSSEWEEWPSAAQAKVRLQVTQAQLNQLIVSRRLTRWQCPDGKLRFKAEDVEELAEEIGGEDDEKERRQAAKERDEELGGVLSRAVSLLKIAQEHTETLFKISTGPVQRGTEFLLRINDQQAQRIMDMERREDANLAAREALISAQHERDLKARKAEMAQENVRHAIDQITGAVGPIVHQVLANLGINLGGMGKPHPGLELLQSIDPALLMSLVQLNLLTPQQLALCKQIWPDLEWPEAPPAAPPAPAGAAPPEPPPQPPPPQPPAAAAPQQPEAAPQAPPPSADPTSPRTPRKRRARRMESTQ